MAEYHAERSPSGADRWMTCPGSIVLCAGRKDEGSTYALEGSAAHEVAAMCLQSGHTADAFLGRLIEVSGHEVPVTQDMADNVQAYVDAVNARIEEYTLRGATVTLEVEQDVPIGHLTLEPGATGRSDAILLAEWPEGDVTIDCWDLKMGRGVEVSAQDNRQGRLYCLGAIEKFGVVYTFRDARITIYQPRISRMPSDWEVSIADLETFGQEVTRASHNVRAAKLCDEGGRVDFADKYLNPSEKACKFCKAKATCPKLREHVATTMLDDFADLTKDAVAQANAQLAERGTDALALAMQAVDLVEDWCKAVRAETERRLLSGVPVPGFKLVEGRQGARKWADPAEAEAVLKSMRLKQEEMYDFTLISPTTAEKLTKTKGDDKPAIGPRQWPKIESLITRAAPKPSVAPESDKRAALAITPMADQFEDLTQHEPEIA